MEYLTAFAYLLLLVFMVCLFGAVAWLIFFTAGRLGRNLESIEFSIPSKGFNFWKVMRLPLF